MNLIHKLFLIWEKHREIYFYELLIIKQGIISLVIKSYNFFYIKLCVSLMS